MMTRTAPEPIALPNTLPNALRLFSIALFVGLAAWLLVTGTAWAQEGYSYVRTVEGYVSLESVDEGTLEAVENQPLIPGDEKPRSQFFMLLCAPERTPPYPWDTIGTADYRREEGLWTSRALGREIAVVGTRTAAGLDRGRSPAGAKEAR